MLQLFRGYHHAHVSSVWCHRSPPPPPLYSSPPLVLHTHIRTHAYIRTHTHIHSHTCVRAHTYTHAQVVVIDEIGTEAEAAAARTIAQRGVQLVATAHGNELANLVKNPALADLVGGIQSVTLGVCVQAVPHSRRDSGGGGAGWGECGGDSVETPGKRQRHLRPRCTAALTVCSPCCCCYLVSSQLQNPATQNPHR